MGDASDQETLDVESACDGEQVGPGLPACSPANGELRFCDAPAANQEAVPEIIMSEHQPPGLSYTIKDQRSFTEFIEALRGILADHPESEDICDRHKDYYSNLSSSKKHPLLAKPRADQQPERWIEVKLQVEEDKEMTKSTTVVIRDDNVDVMGFSDHKGAWYELGNNRGLLPPRYNSKLLAGWVINKEQVASLLVESSTRLGKNFAVGAVRALYRYPEHVPDGVDPRLALVGLSVMVCDSARMNPVQEAIADGWDTGTRFTEQLMTDTVGKYEWMSRSLWQWSRRNYAKPHPTTSQLQTVCLVLNGPPEVAYTIGDEVSFISFMIDLRRNLTDHPDREDILNKHEDRNLSSTHEHPLLPRQRAQYPERWIHVKLQVVEGDKMSWTTLIMRDDNLYVNGFMNQQGVVYGLVDKNKDSAMVLPNPYLNLPVKRLEWSVEYISMLKAASNDDVVKKLEAAHLGREFAMKAVRMLSRYPEVADGDNPRLALAGLIFMVCESARMNPLHNAFARGWSTGTGFTEELMNLYVWNYSKKSSKLRDWKDKRYVQSQRLPHPMKELQDVYLVLNTSLQSSTTSTRTPPGNPSPTPGNPPPSSRSTPPPPTSSTTREAGVASTGGGSGGGGSGSGPNQTGEAANNTGSSSGSASQPGNGGDAATGAGSAFQPVDEGDSSLSRGNSGNQSQDAYDDAQDHGRPLVELLSIHADLRVIGTKIIVYDGIRGQIIYRKEEQRKHIKEQKEQGEQGMVELVLTGPYTCISAYGCFAIQIEIPDDDAGSSTKDAGGPIEWEWDCYDPEYAKEVDKPPVTRTISSSGPGRNVEVTYAVMSNALDARVQVMFWLKDGHGPSSDVVVQGEITARIQDFDVGSVLFSRTQWAGHCFSRTDGSCFRLELVRNVVAVPCGSKLHVRVKLGTKFSNSEDGKDLDVTLDFDNGTLARYHEVDGEKVVEVKITWYPKTEMATAHRPEQFSEVVDEHEFVSALEPSHTAEIARPSHPPEQITIEEAHEQKFITAPSSEQIISRTLEVKMVSGHLTVVYTIGDELSFTEFIAALRRILADHPDREDVLDRHKSSILSSTGEHPVLAKQRGGQPARWIHVKLQAAKMLSTTLIMRADNLYVCGFMNQHGVVYELIENSDGSVGILPVDEYKSRHLSWGVGYRSLLDADAGGDGVVEILTRANMGHDFVMDAVHVLSSFPDRVDLGWGRSSSSFTVRKILNPRMALAGLIVTVCESARMSPIHNFIARWWSNNNMKFTKDLMRDYVLNHGRMSRELLTWKSYGYTNPYPISQLQDIYLVLNYRLDPPQARFMARGRPRVKPHFDSPQARFMARGRPRVELLAMRADLGVVATTVTVFDGKRGHIIYRKEEQGEKGMVDLVLTGPNTSISAYGCFAIKIDIPPAAAGSSSSDAGGSIKWEWDRYDPEYANEVDKPPVTRKISSRPGRNIEVTYAVMSDASEATVQVKMLLKDGNRPGSVHGNITARIGDFKEGIVLFRRAPGMGQRFSPTDSLMLQLSRCVVAVPCGKVFHIEVDLQIETSDNQGVNLRHFNTTLDFENESRSQHPKVDDNEVEVNVTWYPDFTRPMQIEINPWRQPDISYYIVGDSGEGFSAFITELRSLVADHPRRMDVLKEHPDAVRSSTHNHPVLPNGPASHITRGLLHIKLHAGSSVEETPSITLGIRVDTLDIIGFMNQNGDWYNITPTRQDMPILPSEYNAKLLEWGDTYQSILGVGTKWKEVVRLNSEGLGKTFAANAVIELSCFGTTELEAGSDKHKLALVGLMVMICGSARINPVHDHIVRRWKNGAILSEHLMSCLEKWREMSRALLDWKDHVYQGTPQNLQRWKIGIDGPNDALDKVHLVHNDPERLTTTTYD